MRHCTTNRRSAARQRRRKWCETPYIWFDTLSVLKSGPVRFLSAFSSNRTEPVLIFSHFHTGPDQTLKNRLPSVARLFYSGLQPVFGKPVQNRSISCMILLVHTHCSYLLACTHIYSFARVVFIHLCLYYPSWC